MRGAVIYMGKYGSTEQYARWLAEATGFELHNLYGQPSVDFAPYSQLLLGSSVHCGWLRISGWLKRNWPEIASRHPVLFSVSGLPPESPLLRHMVEANLGRAILTRLAYFALPGRLIHSELVPMDRLLLTCEARLGLKLGAHPGHYLSSSGDFNHVSRRRLEPLLQHLRQSKGLDLGPDSAPDSGPTA